MALSPFRLARRKDVFETSPEGEAAVIEAGEIVGVEPAIVPARRAVVADEGVGPPDRARAGRGLVGGQRDVLVAKKARPGRERVEDEPGIFGFKGLLSYGRLG